MAEIKTINLAEFAPLPGGRTRKISTHSAEEFRDDLLLPELRGGKVVVEVNLDGIITIGSSFLEEVFGGVVRKLHLRSQEEFDAKLKIKTTRQDWLEEAKEYIQKAIADENGLGGAKVMQIG